MRIRLAVSSTLVALVLSACGSSSEDFGGPPESSGGNGGSAGVPANGAGRGGSTGATGAAGGASGGVSGANAAGGASGVGGGAAGKAGMHAGAGGGASGAGGVAGKSGMDSGAGGLRSAGGGAGTAGGGFGGVGCGGETGCGPGAPGFGGRPGRSMGGAGAGGTTAGKAGAGGSATAGSAGTGSCPASGHVSYTLTKAANPTADQQQAYDLIVPAMDKAVEYYNCYTNITKADTVTYDPSVQTADGNSNGSIRFGGKDYMEYITAMHEIAHTVGVGTAPKWSSLVVNGIFTGEHATAELRMITGNATDQLNADTQHFWPYGLNYTSEVKSEADVIDHCLIVAQIRLDLGFNP